jgi:hypothetical protein
MEAVFVQQSLLPSAGPMHSRCFPGRKASGHFLPRPLLNDYKCSIEANLSSSSRTRAIGRPFRSCRRRCRVCRSLAERYFVQSVRQGSEQQGLRVQSKLKSGGCQAAAGGAILVQEQSPPLESKKLDREIIRLRKLQEHLRAVASVDEKLQLLENDREVQRVWQALGAEQAAVCGDFRGRYLLDCLIAAGQGHLLESMSLLKARENGRVPSNSSGALLHEHGRLALQSNGSVKNGIHLEVPDTKSDRAPYLEAFHMLADVVRKMEGSGEDAGPSHTALLEPQLHYTPVNAHKWEQRLANGHNSSDAVRPALAKLVEMLARLEKFYDSIGGIVGYQLAALELIRASEEREESIEKMESSLGGDSDEHLSEIAVWDGSELLPDETAETNYHMPVGPDLAADPGFAQQAAAWGLEVRNTLDGFLGLCGSHRLTLAHIGSYLGLGRGQLPSLF